MNDVAPASDVAQDADQAPVQAVIRLDHLRHNVRALRTLAGAARLMGVVKADAYGHGAVQVARVLREEGVRHFAVARIGEAVALRDAGLTAPILVLGAPLPHHLAAYAAHDLGVTVASAAVAEAVIEAAAPHAPLRVHVKVDTGMGRIGLTPDVAPDVIDRLRRAPGVEMAGLWTHFATADADNPTFAHHQLDRFERVAGRVEGAASCVHVANSSALLTLSERLADLCPALVRTGIMLYGLADRAALAAEAGLRPVMQLTAQVTQVKTVPAGTSISYGRQWRADRATRIATLGVGYGDGYPRLCSNRASVALGGHRVPVVGAVCMDMMMVDLGPPGTGPDVAVGDAAVLFGPDGPSAFDVAAWAETIPYEICCRIDERVPRRYVPGV
jgi:alanine racemase